MDERIYLALSRREIEHLLDKTSAADPRTRNLAAALAGGLVELAGRDAVRDAEALVRGLPIPSSSAPTVAGLPIRYDDVV